jgi:hypothetical protein
MPKESKAINPYGDHPVSDFLVAANAGMANMMPFGGVLDRLGLGVNKGLGIGPQTLQAIDAQREADMLRSVPGTVAGGTLGVAGNALMPMEGMIANMASGAIEGGTSDPTKPFSPGGATLGVGLSSIPLLKFLKLDPRGMIPENFVRTKIPVSSEGANLDILKLLAEQVPREATSVWGNIKNKLLPGRLKQSSGIPRADKSNFYDTGARLLAQEERNLFSKNAKGYNNFFSPYGTVKDYVRDLKEHQGLTLGSFASSRTAEAIPHEGIHAAINAASKQSGIPAGQIERAASNMVHGKHRDVYDAMYSLIVDVNGYRPEQFSAELLPFLQGVLTQPKERNLMIRHVFGGNEGAYQKWATEAKRAYRDTVKWAKEVGPADLKKK